MLLRWAGSFLGSFCRPGMGGDYAGWPIMVLMRFCRALSVEAVPRAADSFKIDYQREVVIGSALAWAVVNFPSHRSIHSRGMGWGLPSLDEHILEMVDALT